MTGRDPGPAAEPSELPAHFPPLDGLRAIAILLVMGFHYEVRNWPWPSGIGWPLWAMFREGWLGVDLFFVISGFLITGILYDSRGDPAYFRTFYARRTLRIFPAYYAYLFAMFVVLPVLPRMASWQVATPFEVQVWFWAYLSNIRLAIWEWQATPTFVGHFWSLAVEEQFYLAWPAVVLLARSRRGLMGICLACIAGAFAVRVGLRLGNASWLASYALTPARMDSLAAGGLLALAMRGPGGVERVARLARPLAIVAACAFVALFHWRGLEDVSEKVIGTGGLSVIAFFFATVIAVTVTARPGSLVYRVLTWRVLTQVGKYSYAMYVLHNVVKLMLDASGLSLEGMVALIGWLPAAHFAYVLANSLATFGLAALSWRFIEAPFMRLKDRFPYATRR